MGNGNADIIGFLRVLKVSHSTGGSRIFPLGQICEWSAAFHVLGMQLWASVSLGAPSIIFRMEIIYCLIYYL